MGEERRGGDSREEGEGGALRLGHVALGEGVFDLNAF